MIPDKVTLNGKAVDVGLFGAAAREQIAKALMTKTDRLSRSANQALEFRQRSMSLAEIAARIKFAH